MSEKHDEKCLNPGARPLIINAEHDLRKLHKILQQVRDIFLLPMYFFLRFETESQNLPAIFVSLYFCVRQRLNHSVTVSAGQRCARDF